MIEKTGSILTAAQSSILQSAKNTQSQIDKAQLELSTGKKVNSAIDNPQSFFLSQSLSQKAGDLMQLLDGISSSIGAINTANTGVTAISQLLDQADSLLDNANTELYSGSATSYETSLSASDIAAILAANPGVSYSAASQSFYQLSSTAVSWDTANADAQNATLVEPPGVTGVAGVTGHLANITSQPENDFVQALASGNSIWLGGSDAAVTGEWRWAGGPESGQQFWQGGPGGNTVNGSYANWNAGEPNNAGGVEHSLEMYSNGSWNDLNGSSNLNYVTEWDASLFVPKVDPVLAAQAKADTAQYNQILQQIDFLVKDTQYAGLSLLNGKSITTNFNSDHTSFLTTKGMDATSAGLGLTTTSLLDLDNLNLAEQQVREARQTLRTYSASLAVDFTIISTRLNFTQNNINLYKDGAGELVNADQNQTGAELLALQVRQELQMDALRLSTQSNTSKLFS